MKNLIKRIISAALSVCVLVTMFSMLGAVAVTASAADSEYDSGNMPKAFFTDAFWDNEAESVASFELADGSVKLTQTFIRDFRYLENDGFEVMFKTAGGFELFLRANEDASQGYKLHMGSANNLHKYNDPDLHLTKMGNGYTASTRATINGYDAQTWVKLSVRFIDKADSTEIEIKINDVKLDFHGTTDNAECTVANGNLVDYAPLAKTNTYIKARPYYNGGFESNPNKDTQLYFASIDNEGVVLNSEDFVTRILIIGDSITQGVGGDRNRTSYYAYLQKMLGPNYDVFNAGASGSNGMEGTANPNNRVISYYAGLLFNADYVIYALGTNDGQGGPYWAHPHYYGYAPGGTSEYWNRISAISQDENGNYSDTDVTDDDGNVVGEFRVSEDGTYTYTLTNAAGVECTYECYYDSTERWISDSSGIIDSLINNRFFSDSQPDVIVSSVIESWNPTWDCQAEVFEAQKKLYAANTSGKLIGFVDNYTEFSQYNEDSTSDMYYQKVSDDGLHPNATGHKMMAENIYEVLQSLDLVTEKRDIAYTSRANANANVTVRELNDGELTTVTNEFFSGSQRNADTSTTYGNISGQTTTTLNILDLGYKFNAKFSTIYRRTNTACDYDETFTDYNSKTGISYSFGDLQLRDWRVKDASGTISHVYGLFYKNKLVGNYKYVGATDSSSTMGEKLTFNLSYDQGNVTVTRQRVYQFNYGGIETADTSSATVESIFSYTAADLLAATGDAIVKPINGARFSAHSASYIGDALLIDAQITSNNTEIEYNIQTTEGGSIYANGAIFDNTATYCVGDEVILKAVLNDDINYRFNSWQDSDGNILSTDTEYYVAFVGGEDIIAVFDKIYYSDYAISSTSGGSILMDGEAFVDGTLYEVGIEHTITAVAEDGYTFAGWIDENEEVVTFSNAYTFKIPSAITLKAVFVPTVTANSLTVNATGGGSVDYDEKDTYIIGSYLTLKARGSKYFKFIGWYDETDTLISTNATYNYVVKADNNLTAKFGYALASDFTVTANGGTVTVDGAAFDGTKTYNAGEIHTLNATANEGYTFAYWRVNNKIASYEAEYEIRLEATSNVEAVFTSESASGDVTVSFANREGVIVSSVTVAKDSEITLPQYPTAFGYTAEGWNVNGTVKPAGDKVIASTDMVISVKVTVNADTYTVNVIGSVADTAVSGDYTYNEKITLEFDAEQLASGEYFGGWADANGAVISYEETYVFFVGANTTVSAVIASEAAEIKPIVAVTDVTVINGGGAVSFLTERTTPAGYKYVEAGVLYTSNGELANNMTLETLAGGIKQKAAAQNTANGQFRLALKSREGTAMTAYLRAYLTYVDANGEYVTIYSDVYSGKTVSTNVPDIDVGIEEGKDNF